MKAEELLRKKERILYLQRQMFGRRSEKKLPDNANGAEDNCIFYTLLGSCLQAGIEPHKWVNLDS